VATKATKLALAILAVALLVAAGAALAGTVSCTRAVAVITVTPGSGSTTASLGYISIPSDGYYTFTASAYPLSRPASFALSGTLYLKGTGGSYTIPLGCFAAYGRYFCTMFMPPPAYVKAGTYAATLRVTWNSQYTTRVAVSFNYYRG